MTHIIVTVSKYILIILFAIYTYDCFAALVNSKNEERANRLYRKQTTLMFMILTLAHSVMYLVKLDIRIIGLLVVEAVYLTATLIIFKNMYKYGQKSLVNNMCMLLTISFIILARLDIDKAIRQFMLACVALVITCLIPLFVQKMKSLNRLAYLYAAVGFLLLLLVLVAGSRVYGAKINIKIGGIAIQPSEFVKIIYVFFVAAMFQTAKDFKQLAITTVVAAMHVLILVASKDLGSAGIFFITYLCMFVVYTKKPALLLLGGGGSIVFVWLADKVFTHVHKRILAWSDPLSVADDAGYQITQSLFAIGTGGWFGSGLYQGMPDKIPVVAQDFVFSAISEELGGFFSLCLIFVCMSCFLMIFNIALQMNDSFYKMVALGLGSVYATQIFLTIGGVTKFIPSTGVTLPLVSYGGSSLLSTTILFAVVQGLYAKYHLEIMEKKESELETGKEGREETKKRKKG